MDIFKIKWIVDSEVMWNLIEAGHQRENLISNVTGIVKWKKKLDVS